MCARCRRSLVFPTWNVLLADGQVGAAKRRHGTGVNVHPTSGTVAAVTARHLYRGRENTELLYRLPY